MTKYTSAHVAEAVDLWLANHERGTAHLGISADATAKLHDAIRAETGNNKALLDRCSHDDLNRTIIGGPIMSRLMTECAGDHSGAKIDAVIRGW